MRITVEVSMYPLHADYKPPIKAFVRRLREHSGLATRTNQMSTQVRGDFDTVMGAITACMKQSMADNDKVVFVTKCLNADLDIERLPDID